MKKLRKTYNRLTKKHAMLMKKKEHKGGELVLAIIGLITAIITAITTIVELVKQREAIAAADAEEERRKQEQEKAEREEKILELKQMLYDYNEQLGDLAAKAKMTVKDYIILNLKDASSTVNDMKRTILNKAAEFNMTHAQFIDYCLNISGTNSWWNVSTLLKIMKDEISNPGTISKAKVKT
jgi:hypothetical protein